jgi:hypothetical protein
VADQEIEQVDRETVVHCRARRARADRVVAYLELRQALERAMVVGVLVGVKLDHLRSTAHHLQHRRRLLLDRARVGAPCSFSISARVRFWLSVMLPLRRSSESVKP